MQLFSFPYHFISLSIHLLAFQVWEAFRRSIDIKNITQGCPVFCTGGHNHRRITDFHSKCHVISASSNKMSLFKILKASPSAIVLNKLTSLQIHQLLPFINSKMNYHSFWASLCRWLPWGGPILNVLLQSAELPVTWIGPAVPPADVPHGITLSLEAWCQGPQSTLYHRLQSIGTNQLFLMIKHSKRHSSEARSLFYI